MDLDEYMSKTKGHLDNDLDKYMAKSKSHLDADLDTYMVSYLFSSTKYYIQFNNKSFYI